VLASLATRRVQFGTAIAARRATENECDGKR
jgi:hypothetical protein